MAELWGHTWTSQYGDRDQGTWYKGLKHLTPEEIARGLEKCLELEEKKWPPSLVQFRALCREQKGPAYHQPYKRLPKPRNKELAEKNISRMREILGKDKGEPV